MGDAHEGTGIPNGVVTATQVYWYPALVGGDMGCGASAIAFDGDWALTRDQGTRLLQSLGQLVPTLKHRDLHQAPGLPDSCRPAELHHPGLAKVAEREGRWELGTLGRGNHFLELATDRSGRLWAVVHTGSRAMGPALLCAYTTRETDRRDGFQGFESTSGLGASWFHDAQWLVRYASTSRLSILNRIADLVELAGGPRLDEASYIDSPHNFPRIEEYQGKNLCIHRKSVNSAALEEPGIIPGSMVSGSRIVRGRGNEASLCSSSHGAGRALSRKEAFERLRVRDFNGLMGNIVYRQDLAGRLLDEAPQAYRNLDQVMANQSDLVRTVDHLTPILNDKRV